MTYNHRYVEWTVDIKNDYNKTIKTIVKKGLVIGFTGEIDKYAVVREKINWKSALNWRWDDKYTLVHINDLKILGD